MAAVTYGQVAPAPVVIAIEGGPPGGAAAAAPMVAAQPVAMPVVMQPYGQMDAGYGAALAGGATIQVTNQSGQTVSYGQYGQAPYMQQPQLFAPPPFMPQFQPYPLNPYHGASPTGYPPHTPVYSQPYPHGGSQGFGVLGSTPSTNGQSAAGAMAMPPPGLPLMVSAPNPYVGTNVSTGAAPPGVMANGFMAAGAGGGGGGAAAGAGAGAMAQRPGAPPSGGAKSAGAAGAGAGKDASVKDKDKDDSDGNDGCCLFVCLAGVCAGLYAFLKCA